MITRYIVGDITETELKYIAHGVNCQNKMGSGVAKALYTKWEDVKKCYHAHNKEMSKYPVELLGQVDAIEVTYKPKRMVIFNCYTQYNFGYDGVKYVNYAAIVKCFSEIAETYKGETIAIPKIGCGLAGGDWKFVEQLINDTVGDDLEIWVYTLDESKPSRKNDNA